MSPGWFLAADLRLNRLSPWAPRFHSFCSSHYPPFIKGKKKARGRDTTNKTKRTKKKQKQTEQGKKISRDTSFADTITQDPKLNTSIVSCDASSMQDLSSDQKRDKGKGETWVVMG